MFRLFPGRSGQAATEYLMIAAFIGVLIIPATFLYYSYAQETSKQIDAIQIDRFGRNIVSTAERFYYHGHPSTIQLEETLPANIVNMTIEFSPASLDDPTDTYLLVVTLRGNKGENVSFGFPTDVVLNGTFGPRSLTPGKKKVRISAAPAIGDRGPFVTINLEEEQCYEGPDTLPKDGYPDTTIAHNACGEITTPVADISTMMRCFNGVWVEDCKYCSARIVLVCPVLKPTCNPDTSLCEF